MKDRVINENGINRPSIRSQMNITNGPNMNITNGSSIRSQMNITNGSTIKSHMNNVNGPNMNITNGSTIRSNMNITNGSQMNITNGSSIKHTESADDKKIGSGSYGDVYRYGKYAVKCMKIEVIDIALKEIIMMKMMRHENLMGISRHELRSSGIYLYMEYLPMSLYTLIRKLPGIHRRDANKIFRGIIMGVSYLHQRGIIHGDLKPGNIMIKPDNTPVIIDFGLARSNVHKYKSPLVQTKGYRAPEIDITADKCNYGRKIDIFSIGCIMYRLLYSIKLLGQGIIVSEDSTVDLCRILGLYKFNDRMQRLRILNNLTTKYISNRIRKDEYSTFIEDITDEYITKLLNIIAKCIMPNPRKRINIVHLAKYFDIDVGQNEHSRVPQEINFGEYIPKRTDNIQANKLEICIGMINGLIEDNYDVEDFGKNLAKVGPHTLNKVIEIIDDNIWNDTD
jgi:serine/threonine protein kinase